MKTLYIVTGTTGEYSKQEEWLVRGFFDHAKAQAFRDSLEAKAREFGLYQGSPGLWEEFAARLDIVQKMVPFDEAASLRFNGITYFIQECEVDDE